MYKKKSLYLYQYTQLLLRSLSLSYNILHKYWALIMKNLVYRWRNHTKNLVEKPSHVPCVYNTCTLYKETAEGDDKYVCKFVLNV